MQNIFKNKNDEEGNGVTDKLVTKVLQLLELVAVIIKKHSNVQIKTSAVISKSYKQTHNVKIWEHRNMPTY